MDSVALLSHRFGNIGHLFMAIGVEHIARKAFGSQVFVHHFEQHRPFDIHSTWHPLRLFNRLPVSKTGLIKKIMASEHMQRVSWQTNRDLKFQMAIACGGPNIVPGASSVPEIRLLLHHMNGAFTRQGVPFADIGVGACLPIESNSLSLFNEEDRAFYKKAFDLVDVLSVRDKNAQKFCEELNVKAKLIPCAAIASGFSLERYDSNVAESDSFILINFMEKGANEDWGQNVDAEKWFQTVKTTVKDLQKRHKIKLIAHSRREEEIGARIMPDAPCVWPKNLEEYANYISGAKVGLVSRIHAAIPLAGIGVPSVVIGTDSRLDTVEQMGLPSFYVKDVSPEKMIESVELLVEKRLSEKLRLKCLRDSVVESYREVLLSISSTTTD